MDVSGEHDVDASLIEQPLHGDAHPLALALVRLVRVVPRRVEQHQQPWRAAAVDAREVPRQPPVLLRPFHERRVRAQHDDVRRAARRVERVVEVRRRRRRRRPTRLVVAVVVRHPPPRVVGDERLDELPHHGDPRQRLHLVVALRHHPRPRARQRLHETAERVPQRLLRVRVIRQVPREEQHVVVAAAAGGDVRQRRRRPPRLAEVADDDELDGQRGRRRPEGELVAGPPAPVVVGRAGLKWPDGHVVDRAGLVEEVAVRRVVARR